MIAEVFQTLPYPTSEQQLALFNIQNHSCIFIRQDVPDISPPTVLELFYFVSILCSNPFFAVLTAV